MLLKCVTSFCQRTSAPILFVTAREHTVEKVRGLELGADDYVVKPFNPDELGARIRAVLRRRVGQGSHPVVRAGEVEIDLARRLVTRSGEPVALTPTEWAPLQQLAANAGRAMVTRELLSKAWGPEYRDDPQYLHIWILRLRKKLEQQPSHPTIIKTLPGIGYLFEAEAEVESESGQGHGADA